MKTTWITFLAVVFCTWGTNRACALLDDGSFELSDSHTTISNSAWVLDVIPANEGARFIESDWGSSHGTKGVWFRSFTGSTANPADAFLYQAVTAPKDGVYLLTFDAARELNFLVSAWSVSLSSSGTGGTNTVDLLATVPNDGSFFSLAHPQSLTLSGVTAGDTLLVSAHMLNGINANADPQSAFVDNFSLVWVPEPSSVLLMGAAIVALALRRHRVSVS